jgi:hypothetical protein
MSLVEVLAVLKFRFELLESWLNKSGGGGKTKQGVAWHRVVECFIEIF